MTITTATRTEQEQERIASAKFVYIVAEAGCGKTFTGDYLNLMHGYSHVDGDCILKNCHIPKNRELTYRFLKSYDLAQDHGEDGPEELWKPFYEEIAMLTLDAAKHSDHVVLTHASYRQAYRKCVVKKLIEGGAKRENITILQLSIDMDVKLKGLYHRTKEQCESGGMTLGDGMRSGGWEGEGDITLSGFIKFSKEQMQKSTGGFENIPNGYGITVDVSGRDLTHLHGVDEALLLKRSTDDEILSFEEIKDKVKLIDQARDEEFGSNGSLEIMIQISKELNGEGTDDDDDDDEIDNTNTDADIVKDIKEQEKSKNRRSSLASVEYLSREFLRSSLNSNDSEEQKKIMKGRRVSLINTGKI